MTYQAELKSSELSEQYLTFVLDQDLFATGIDQVHEVLELTQITRVPRSPAYLRGVINLRGSVVPVVDLRLQFGMSAIEPTVDTCIIIFEVQIDGEDIVLGALADSVQEVLEIGRSDLEPPPSLGTRINVDFITAMAKHGNDFLVVLDINQVFSGDQLSEMSMAQGQLDASNE